MQFYLIPSTPPQLVGTQADGVAACKPLGIKFDPEAMAHDVPTSKAELMAYVNERLAQRSAPLDREAIVNSNSLEAQLQARELMKPEGSRGPLRCASCSSSPQQITQAAVHAIEVAEGYQLGNLAWAVAERFAEMGGPRK